MVAEQVEVNFVQRTQWILNTIFHQAVAVVTVFLLWVFFRNYELDNSFLWHLVLSTAAYVPLMAEGIILFYGDNVWSQRLERPKKNLVHGILLGISVIALTVGIGVEISSKNKRGSKHFKSNHAITGLVSWILAFLSVVLGIFSSKAQDLKNFARPVIFKFVHNSIGIACFAIGIASLCLGFYFRSFKRLVTENQQHAVVWVVGILSFWSCLSAFKAGYSQLKNMFS